MRVLNLSTSTLFRAQGISLFWLAKGDSQKKKMTSTVTHLRLIINQALPLLQAISDGQASIKPNPGKWSQKEIIGHLIDSAANNHQKFVRAMESDKIDFPAYQQDEWVRLQQYNMVAWDQLLQLWQVYNLHLAHIMDAVPEESLQHQLYISGKGPFTLEFILNDYTEHLKHHLNAILPEAELLTNKFQMVY